MKRILVMLASVLLFGCGSGGDSDNGGGNTTNYSGRYTDNTDYTHYTIILDSTDGVSYTGRVFYSRQASAGELHTYRANIAGQFPSTPAAGTKAEFVPVLSNVEYDVLPEINSTAPVTTDSSLVLAVDDQRTLYQHIEVTVNGRHYGYRTLNPMKQE